MKILKIVKITVRFYANCDILRFLCNDNKAKNVFTEFLLFCLYILEKL